MIGWPPNCGVSRGSLRLVALSTVCAIPSLSSFLRSDLVREDGDTLTVFPFETHTHKREKHSWDLVGTNALLHALTPGSWKLFKVGPNMEVQFSSSSHALPCHINFHIEATLGNLLPLQLAPRTLVGPLASAVKVE